MGPAGAVVYGENSLFGRRRHTTRMGNFRHRQDGRGSPNWRHTYLSFDLDTMELLMDAARCDALLRSFSTRASRCGALAGLASGLLVVGPLALGGHEAGPRRSTSWTANADPPARMPIVRPPPATPISAPMSKTSLGGLPSVACVQRTRTARCSPGWGRPA